jgi:sigma-B regulation protein RsbU (phosphoserine phosphatase)
MEENTIQRIEKGLVEKRENLYHWLESASAEEKQVCLCEDQACIDPHLQVIETSLEKAEQGTLGICKVCHGNVETSVLEVDYTASVCLDHFSSEERRRLEAELELSQVIQRALLPQELPSVPGLELAVFSRPAEILGGDYFDFFQFNDGAFGLAIADVVGHGVSAGMLMSSLQTSLRTLVPQGDSPAEVLERVNHFYLHNIHVTTFITAFLGHYDSATRILTYSNAGHTPPLVLQGQGSKEIWLKPTSAAIGLVEGYNSEPARISLSKGDVLLFYTDGVTETTGPKGEQFGTQRLAALIEARADQPAQELVSALRQEVYEFSSGRPSADDITILALKIN